MVMGTSKNPKSSFSEAVGLTIVMVLLEVAWTTLAVAVRPPYRNWSFVVSTKISPAVERVGAAPCGMVKRAAVPTRTCALAVIWKMDVPVEDATLTMIFVGAVPWMLKSMVVDVAFQPKTVPL